MPILVENENGDYFGPPVASHRERAGVKGVCSWVWVRALLGDPGISVRPWLHSLVQAAPSHYGHVSGLLIMTFVWLAG